MAVLVGWVMAQNEYMFIASQNGVGLACKQFNVFKYTICLDEVNVVGFMQLNALQMTLNPTELLLFWL